MSTYLVVVGAVSPSPGWWVDAIGVAAWGVAPVPDRTLRLFEPDSDKRRCWIEVPFTEGLAARGVWRGT